MLNLSKLLCPICGSTEFNDFNGRPLAQCASCKSLERTRLMWMILNSVEILKPGIRVLHVAPEVSLIHPLKKICGDLYHPCDIDPKKYKNKHVEIFSIDLCVDLFKMPSKNFDLIIHNHVLEHLPCVIGPVIHQIHRILKVNGMHLFSVPFIGEKTEEDLNPNLTDEVRRRRFAQFDHMRIFGTDDFPRFLDNEFGGDVKLVPLNKIFTEAQLLKASVPVSVLTEISGHSFFSKSPVALGV